MNSFTRITLATLASLNVTWAASFTPTALTVMTDTNGIIVSPSNFWSANNLATATLILDGSVGDDSTGTRGTALPFSTLTAALAAMQSGDVLLIRPGTYRVDAEYYDDDDSAITLTNILTNLDNVTLYGPGATIYATNYGNMLTIQNCSNVVLDGLTFRYSEISTNTIGTNSIVAAVNHRQTNTLTTIRNCSFINCPDQAISHCWPQYARPSTDWTIEGCYFENIGTTNHPFVSGAHDGAMVSGRPRRLLFIGNRSSGLNVYGVELDGGGSGSPADVFGEALISGNNLRGMYRHAVVASGTTNCPVRNLTVVGNYIEFDAGGGGAGVLLGAAQNVLVAANTFKGDVQADSPTVTKSWGVNLTTTYGEECYWSNVTVRANSFIGMAYGCGTAFAETTIASRIFGLTISDNTFMNQGEAHIMASGAAVSVTGNTFLGAGKTASPTYPYAIYLYDFTTAPLTNCIVRGNVLNDIGTSATTTRLLRVSSVASTKTSSLLVRDNEVFRMSGTNAYSYTAGVASTPTISYAATHAIVPGRSVINVEGSGGAVTLTSTPSIVVAIDGVTLTLVGTSDSNTLTLQDDGTLAGSGLQLGSTNRLLGLGDSLSLRFNGTVTNWFETGYNNN